MDENLQKKHLAVLCDAALNLLALFHEITVDLEDSSPLDAEIFETIQRKKQWLLGKAAGFNFKSERSKFKELTRSTVDKGDISPSPHIGEYTEDAEARLEVFSFVRNTFNKTVNTKHPHRFEGWLHELLNDYQKALIELDKIASRGGDFVELEVEKLNKRLPAK